MRPAHVSSAPVQEVVEPPRLDRLPNLWSWPRDGGPFITFGPTLTENPRTHARNFGLYRLQVFDADDHRHALAEHEGRAGHHFEAEREHQPLEAAVVLGGDPVTMLSAILPLPEDMDELSCAGYVRGAPTRFVKAKSISLEVPANAEFILEGTVPPDVRRLEGPFGDHFGHYSEAEMFPVFNVRR